MSFVKASVIYDSCESVRYDDQNSSKLNKKGKAGIGYLRPENSKPSWLKNRLDKGKAKAGSKSFVSHQRRRSSKKVKSVWRKVQPRRDLNGQNIKPTLNRSHNISAQNLMDYHTGKTVKISLRRTLTQLSEMASSYISNAMQIIFDSVLGIQDNDGMELEQFFDIALIQDGDVTCAVSGKYVEISASRFVGVFNLPTDGLIDLSEVPNDLVAGKNSVLKIWRPCGNFGRGEDLPSLENYICEDREHKGFDAQICVLLKGDPAVTLGEAKTFPPSKIISAKTVNTYVATNKKIDARGEIDEPDEATVKKRTSSGKAVSKEKYLAIVLVALYAEPIQTVDLTSAMPAAHPPAPKRKTPKRKLRMTAGSDDDIVEEESAVETVVVEQKRTTSVDDVDTIIEEVIAAIAQMEQADFVESAVAEGIEMETDLTKSDDIVAERSIAVTDEEVLEPLSKVLETSMSPMSDDESLTIEEHLAKIPEGMMLPSLTSAEPTKSSYVVQLILEVLRMVIGTGHIFPRLLLMIKGRDLSRSQILYRGTRPYTLAEAVSTGVHTYGNDIRILTKRNLPYNGAGLTAYYCQEFKKDLVPYLDSSTVERRL
ncbi:hypothetical protein F511_40763 [Dorcoceras hygrometricum]|uniref:Uncharacterized protein n=1 Tax=Dorcoceras hygrometricum TaxID=472368 RepID=A0A2Z7AIV5_9LAMI|nr:hypothetical protein F511_40763 [Dorcoceras hygrometricum]